MITDIKSVTPFLQIPELTWSPFRGRERPDYLMDGSTENICKYWAGIATGKHNQDVSFMLEGPKGTGKSYSGLSLCINCAKWIAEFLGDDWRDHFDIERTAAIIDTDKADDVMLNTGKHDVRFFDDISLAWGNRNWQSDENKDKNDIFIINRIDNTINILTSPNSKLIDVVPRSNVNFKGEMDTPYFAFGHTSMKVFKPQPMFRASGYKVLDPYIKVGRDKIVLYMIEAPSKNMIDAYNKERTRATEAVKADRKAKLAERRGESDPAKPVKVIAKKINPKVKDMQDTIRQYGSIIVPILQNGGTYQEVRKALTTKGELDSQRARRWTSRTGMLEEIFEIKK